MTGWLRSLWWAASNRREADRYLLAIPAHAGPCASGCPRGDLCRAERLGWRSWLSTDGWWS